MGDVIDSPLTIMDTSGNIYRNSSTKRGGFEGEIGLITTDSELDVTGTEDVTRTVDVLNDAERTRLADMIGQLTACTTAALCADKADFVTRAGAAWDRAWNLFPTYRAELDAELADMKQEMLDEICLMESQWARAAGSNLNTLVQRMRAKSVEELARRIAGMIADRRMQAKEHETEAITQAFEMNMNGRMEPNKAAFAQIGTLYSILKGSLTTDVTDRDYTEHRDEDEDKITAMGKFYHEAIDVSDASGTYASDVDAAWAASNLVAGGIGA